ncbi:hypothetical protein ANN_17970 [Periplaneta americana]|uniref:Uncharacterized protein n=1 Tax=Periplaneta americana TaxID=6978 RepID=A0ABQ8SMH1_PERAM|nr:hypothetical protein ANN_17970 [Periplaneta americana]
MDLREVGYDDRECINLAQDRDRWRAYVRAAMNLRNLVVPPLVAITAATQAGMLSTSLCRISTGMRSHSSCNMALSWTMEVGPMFQRLLCSDMQTIMFTGWTGLQGVLISIPLSTFGTKFDRRLRSREMWPTSIVQLSAMLQEEWRRIPVDILHKLVENMPARVAAVIATRGSTTRF